MKRSGRDSALRGLPSVDDVLRSDAAKVWLAGLPRERVAELVRDAVGQSRSVLLSGSDGADSDPRRDVEAAVGRSVRRLQRLSLRPVINASGVILHTNLGRAPLAKSALRAMADTAGRYCNLEYDIGQGRRGKRDAHCEELLERLLGTSAIVVNNNAAAIFLVLNELASEGNAVVSRGELVEIGDGFRIPDILKASRAGLKEVGTTNRTSLEDYSRAIDAETKVLLRVHPSNFRLVGFSGRPSLSGLVDLARSRTIPLIEDLGSGCLTDLGSAGLEGESPVTASLRAGVDVVTFSGDKLLGGPQAGIIAGDRHLVARMRRNPLFRALRVDKLTLAALCATLLDYFRGDEDAIPALRLMRYSADEIAARARTFARRLREAGCEQAEVVAGESLLGGGSTPMQSLATALIAISPASPITVGTLERRLRESDPPVVARIEANRLLLDLRTVFETEEEELLVAVLQALAASREPVTP